MAKSKTKQSCFIIMPITTPIDFVEQYKDDIEHFSHVLEHLFKPALENAGFEPIPPKSKGSDVIQAEIIKRLSSCDLVLCDMSILNPNVFFEFGIRTALDKPVALVVDDKTKEIPFDTNMLNFHKYDSSLAPWTLEEQKQKLEKHVQDAYKKSKNRNALWKYFGITQTGTFKSEDAELGNKIDVILEKLTILNGLSPRSEPSSDFVTSINDLAPLLEEPLTGTEKKILYMILEGKSNNEIARVMHRSKRTIESHRRRLKIKFGADNLIEHLQKVIDGGQF